MSKNKVHDVYRKSNFIAEELRSQILDGVYGPGDRLPTRDNLVLKYDVSKVTVQRALEQLMEDGFASAKVGCGTIVPTDSPHLTCYALLFPQSETESREGQLWTALANEAKSFPGDCEFELYYAFDGRRGVERYQALVKDVENRRLAGLIFASHPYLLENTPLLDKPGIPRVALMTPHGDFHLPAVNFDFPFLHKKIIQEVTLQKFRKVGLIVSDNANFKSIKEIQAGFEQAGINIKSDWINGVSARKPEWGISLTRLLMKGEDRPDCLVVLDDNLLPSVSEGLKSLNLIPPRDLTLISHCNFPWPTYSAVPVIRIGYCIKECLKTMMQQINDQQNKKEPKSLIRIPAYTEYEYPHKINFPKK